MPQPRSNPGLSNAQYAKLLIFTNALIPLALLLYDIDRDQTGPDEVSFILHTTGLMALICLLASLAITPLRKLTGNSFFMHFRRMLGLFAFFYAGLHLLAYLEYQRGWNFRAALRDVVTTRYIFFGLAAFTLMIPLALTSTAGAVKRLGAARWKRLHQLVYITAICAVVHFYLLVKRDERLPLMFIAILAVLLGLRVMWRIARSAKPPRRPTPQPQ